MIGSNIKKFRKIKGMSQAKLSEKTNIPQTTISDLENGKYIPKIDVLYAISKALNVNIEDIYTELRDKK